MALNRDKNAAFPSSMGDHGKINFLQIIFFGLIILAVSSAVYLFILRESFGSFPADDLVPSVEKFRKIFNKQPKIAVLYPDYTTTNLNQERAKLKAGFHFWKNFFLKSQLCFDILGNKEIGNGKHFQYTALVLPGPISLNPGEADQLKKYLKTGGSLFASGKPDIYSNEALNTTGSLFKELFSLDFSADSIRSDSLNLNPLLQFSVFRGGMPLTSGIPAGYKIQIAGDNIQRALLLKNAKASQISFSSSINEPANPLSTSVYGVYVKGRFVWIGFNIGSVMAEQDEILFEKFLSNSINWLLHEPVACIKDFPGEYKAAAVIAPVLSDSIKNIYNILEVLSGENIKASFFIDPEKSIENLPLISNLYKYGETAVYFRQPGNYPPAISELKKNKRTIELAAGSRCVGCTIFPEINIEKTAYAVREAGFKYLLSQSTHEYISENKKITVFNASFNDYDSFNTGIEPKFNRCKEDIDSIYYIHGVYIFKIPDDNHQKIPGYLEKVIGHLKNKNYLITTFAEIQERFYKIRDVEINTERMGARRISLHISNKGENSIYDVAVDLDLNVTSPVNSIYINPLLVRPRKVKVVEINSMGILSLVFEELKPGESRSYYIDFNAENI